MYVRDLNGAKPIEFKTKINCCPPDCGGEDFDEIEYVPVCPNCNKEFDYPIPNYCPNCGQKLYGKVKYPRLIEDDDN